MDNFADLKGAKTIIDSRNSLTGEINLLVEMMEQSNKTIKRNAFNQEVSILRDMQTEIRSLNEKIKGLCVKADLDLVGSGFVTDQRNQIIFRTDTNNRIGTIEEFIRDSTSSAGNKAVGIPEIASPKLQCTTFSGMNPSKFEYKIFLPQFENCIGTVKCQKYKLALLKSYLTGYALQLVSHLSLEEENYDIAISMLNKEFLDIPFIINEIFKQIINASLKYDPEFSSVKRYLAEVRADLSELKTSYSLDFFEENTPGSMIVGHIVCDKLPVNVRREISHRVGNNYPTLKQIFENYNDAIGALAINKKPYSTVQIHKSHSKDEAALQNFTTTSEGIQCKFCDARGHSMNKCDKFTTHSARIQRCRELDLCISCTSSRHKAEKCPGAQNGLRYPCKHCSSKSHVTPLCKIQLKGVSLFSHVCANRESEGNYMLPIISITLHHKGSKTLVNCLLDTGSQRSYFSRNVLKKLRCHDKMSNPVDFQVKTYLGTATKRLEQVTMKIDLGGKKFIHRSILLDDGFDIQFEFDHLGAITDNLTKLNYKMAFFKEEQSNQVKIQGILGVDIFQFMKQARVIKCMNGSAWWTPNGIAPFGDVQHFLYDYQASAVETKPGEGMDNYHTIISKNASCPERMLENILNPEQTYPDIYPDIFEFSNVERNLEKMFAVDAAATSLEEDLTSEYDKNKIEKFKESIELKNNAYYVNLPWLEDKIKKVPSNYQVALKVLDRTMHSLERKKLDGTYLDIFRQQEAEGIIEKIKVSPQNFNKYIWIPHRPVFKADQQTTTKIRPVFNCSLKTGGAYSLNEAAYPGVNLINDMFELLLLFVTNKYVLLGDIRKAFLMIKLKSEKDKNRFCFFMKDGDKLLCYRYTTLIFGFNASPFILNYVIKHHINHFPDDACTGMLKSRFYVDNLCMTSNSPDELISLYKEAVPRLQEGNFQLRSCNSNCEPLKSIMSEEGTIVQHGCEYEKVLGYNYHPKMDIISVANTSVKMEVFSKREVLAQAAKIFDPLSLYSPVMINTKILLRKLWSLKLSWDEELPVEMKNLWSNMADDLSGLHNISFPRHAVDIDSPLKLCLFCDASPQAYGFVVYGIQNEKSHIIFSKVKVAPMKPKTLPMMELLAVYSAIKALATLLKSYSKIKIENVYVAVDAQVVLSWLLTENIKTKSLFTRNRLRDVQEMKKQLHEKFAVDINFKYVPSAENPADLLTRGITLEKFQQNLDYWTHGPTWLVEVEKWPTSSLNCLSTENKCQVDNVFYNTLTDTNEEPMISFDRFSKFNKLCNATAFVFKFISKCKRLTEQPEHISAEKYLIKIMQRQTFCKEIAYLQDPTNKEIPILVKNLNIFLDSDGILRVDGRIAKATNEYNLIYPILIAKNHPLSTLIINSCHSRCKHLGIGTTVTKLRLSGYWIPQARQSVKAVISKCYACKKVNTLAFKYPKLTNLPEHRVKFIKPFQHTGIDYTGHIWVQENGKSSKMYLLIFTCMNVRAIHIELVPDMSTHAFIQALIRFCNIYGAPTHIYSDNARSFKAALGGDVIKHHVDSDEFNRTYTNSVIKHIKIPLYSPWYGSTWERLIRVIKSCLYKTLGRAKVDYFHLLTLLSDIQRAVNSRPLTYRCSTDNDLMPLTPSSFIQPNVNCELSFQAGTPSVIDSQPMSRSTLIHTLEAREKLLNKFKILWFEEYLLSLRETCKDLHETEFHNRIKENDIVIIKNPAKPRPFWKLGRVLELFRGDDNRVRSARIKRGDGIIDSHSLKHLHPLELSLTQPYTPNSPAEDEENTTPSSENITSSENDGEPITSTDKTTSNRSKRVKKSRSDPEYIYYLKKHTHTHL